VAWVVDELGRRRHIPDGYSFECYKERGYRVAELNLSYDQANSIPEVGRMGYCLAKWQANGTIIREYVPAGEPAARTERVHGQCTPVVNRTRSTPRHRDSHTTERTTGPADLVFVAAVVHRPCSPSRWSA
jgi:hypothetical protein